MGGSGQWWRICLPIQETPETPVQSLSRVYPLEEEMATHSSVLVGKNPMDREAWQTEIHGVTEELDTTEQQ